MNHQGALQLGVPQPDAPAKHDRAAALALPSLPLQILVRDRGWRGVPIAVVSEEGPDGILTHINKHAMRAGLHIGLRQGPARNLVPSLHTGVISEAQVEAVNEEIARSLVTFSPRVERDRVFENSFFIDPNGLERLYGGLLPWAKVVHGYLSGRRFRVGLVIGYERYLALSLARQKRGTQMLRSREEERERAGALPLRALGLPNKLSSALDRLGINTLKDFAALPAGELHDRFGRDAASLHRLFNQGAPLPLQPKLFDEDPRVSFAVEPPDANHARLLFGIKGALSELTTMLAARGEQVAALSVRFQFEARSDVKKEIDARVARERQRKRGGQSRLPVAANSQNESQSTPPLSAAQQDTDKDRVHLERLEPAAPTSDPLALLELCRLRLADLSLPALVEEITIEGQPVRASARQLESELTQETTRDLEAGARALARVRAAFGERAVTRVTLREAHLPEARFRFEPTLSLNAPRVNQEVKARVEQADPPPRVFRVAPKPAGLSLVEETEEPEDVSLFEPSDERDVETAESVLESGEHPLPRPLVILHPREKPSLPSDQPPLVRRLFKKPKPLRALDPRDPSRGPELPGREGHPPRLYGPYRVHGGWWVRDVERDYYYAEISRPVSCQQEVRYEDEILWIYFDRMRERWFVHGVID